MDILQMGCALTYNQYLNNDFKHSEYGTQAILVTLVDLSILTTSEPVSDLTKPCLLE